jgi:hypothetical protein
MPEGCEVKRSMNEQWFVASPVSDAASRTGNLPHACRKAAQMASFMLKSLIG